MNCDKLPQTLIFFEEFDILNKAAAARSNSQSLKYQRLGTYFSIC